MEIGWPNIAASASMPPTPQPSTDKPLIIVVWELVPTSVSRIGEFHLVFAFTLFFGPNGLRQIFQVYLVADPCASGAPPGTAQTPVGPSAGMA